MLTAVNWDSFAVTLATNAGYSPRDADARCYPTKVLVARWCRDLALLVRPTAGAPDVLTADKLKAARRNKKRRRELFAAVRLYVESASNV